MVEWVSFIIRVQIVVTLSVIAVTLFDKAVTSFPSPPVIAVTLYLTTASWNHLERAWSGLICTGAQKGYSSL